MKNIKNIEHTTILAKAIAEINNNEYNKAINTLDELLNTNGISEKVYYYLGLSHFKISEYQKAVYYLEKSIDIKSSEKSFTMLALSYGELKQFNKVIEILNKALLIYRNSADLYSYLGITQRTIGFPHEAIESFNKALKYDKNHLGANWGLGVTYGIVEDIDNSLKYLTNAVKIKPLFAPAHFHRALNYIALSDYNSAKEELSILETFNNNYADSLRKELGKIHPIRE